MCRRFHAGISFALYHKTAVSIYSMMTDGWGGKKWHGSGQFFCLASEEPVCGVFLIKIKNAVKQAKLHHKPGIAKSETRADAVAAHGIIVSHGNQVPVIVVKHLAMKLRVVIVR